MLKRFLLFVNTMVGIGMLAFASISLAVAQASNPPDDPVEFGAWLYGGYCTRCHGPYEKSIAGESLESDELRDSISGAGRGCQVDWGILYGGPLKGKEIDALLAFILAWREAEGLPNLPSLPVFPTLTPQPTFTPNTLKPTEFPTPTPILETDPRILLIINGNPTAMGARLYTTRCYRCHLSYSFGRMGMGLDEERIKRTINEGKAGTSMPAFGLQEGGDLKIREVNAIVAYILAWEKLGSEPALPDQLFLAPTPDPQMLGMSSLVKIPPVEGRIEKGLSIYLEHCQDCHGLNGEGRVGPSLHRTWNSVRADLTILSTIYNGIPGTPMQAYKEKLSEEEIHSLVALILSWMPEPQRDDDTTLIRNNLINNNYLKIIIILVVIFPLGWTFLCRGKYSI